eukprot:scaffold88499_cov63-Phaeocystis_antarctica.AAC.3
MREHSVTASSAMVHTACAWVGNSRPEASANSPSSMPRERRIQPRAASSLGQPRPLADVFWRAGHTGLVFHMGVHVNHRDALADEHVAQERQQHEARW